MHVCTHISEIKNIYILYIYMYVLHVCIYDVYNVSVKLRSGYDM